MTDNNFADVYAYMAAHPVPETSTDGQIPDVQYVVRYGQTEHYVYVKPGQGCCEGRALGKATRFTRAEVAEKFSELAFLPVYDLRSWFHAEECPEAMTTERVWERLQQAAVVAWDMPGQAGTHYDLVCALEIVYDRMA